MKGSDTVTYIGETIGHEKVRQPQTLAADINGGDILGDRKFMGGGRVLERHV